MKHTLSQQFKSHSPITHAFNELELVHFAFDDSIAVRQSEPCKHSGSVSLDAAHEALKFSDMTVAC